MAKDLGFIVIHYIDLVLSLHVNYLRNVEFSRRDHISRTESKSRSIFGG